MAYFASNISFCRMEKNMSAYVYNITSPYTDNTNRASIVGTSVAMFTLTALFFNLNFFSRVSHASTILHPTVRLVRSAELSLFLPVMSYLFSDAKSAGGGHGSSGLLIGGAASPADLSLRARLILTWMILVELLRRKVEAILPSVGVQRYSANVDAAARVVWLGNLVFFSIESPGRRAVFGLLWVIAAAKLVQRVAISEFIKRSFAHGRNPEILTAYTAEMLAQERHVRQDEEHPSNVRDEQELLLKSCKFAVTGEENLEKTIGPHGYRVNLDKDIEGVITVGKIWTAAEHDDLLVSNPRLKRLCLSFALYKLLRRRLENPLAISKLETQNCRDLIFNGLRNQGDPNAAAVVLFQVVNDEVHLLSEYYHSVLPVVLASPFFFIVNYFLFPITVFCLCLMTIVLCGNGDVPVIFSSIRTDNYFVSFGASRMMICLLSDALRSPPALLSAIDLSITFLLFLIYIYEELWEFIVFLFSDRFMVSLLCGYAARPQSRERATFRGAIRCILLVRSKQRPHTLQMKQLDVLTAPCRLHSMMLPAVPVPTEAKRFIVDCLACDRDGDDGGGGAPICNGRIALARQYSHLSWACESESIADVILTWHIATSLFEVKYPERKGTAVSPGRRAATRLSRYCAYLVAFQPDLLPDNRNDAEHVLSTVKTELKEELGCWGYYFSLDSNRYNTMMAIAGLHAEDVVTALTVVKKGARLGKALVDNAARDGEGVMWKLLADLWVELVLFLAPSSDEEQVTGHKAALVEGGEFVTLLWALATHTGRTRPAVASTGGGAGFEM